MPPIAKLPLESISIAVKFVEFVFPPRIFGNESMGKHSYYGRAGVSDTQLPSR